MANNGDAIILKVGLQSVSAERAEKNCTPTCDILRIQQKMKYWKSIAINPFNACSKLLLFKGFSAILV